MEENSWCQSGSENRIQCAGQASNFSVNAWRMRSMSELRPLTKSSHGGKFLNAVIAKLSDRVKATNGNPCFEAGLKFRLPTR